MSQLSVSRVFEKTTADPRGCCCFGVELRLGITVGLPEVPIQLDDSLTKVSCGAPGFRDTYTRHLGPHLPRTLVLLFER